MVLKALKAYGPSVTERGVGTEQNTKYVEQFFIITVG
jgi:hypothetical protein